MLDSAPRVRETRSRVSSPAFSLRLTAPWGATPTLWTPRSRRSISAVSRAILRRVNSACAQWSLQTFVNTSAKRSVFLIRKANSHELECVEYSRRGVRQFVTGRNVQLRVSTRLPPLRRRDPVAERFTRCGQDDLGQGNMCRVGNRRRRSDESFIHPRQPVLRTLAALPHRSLSPGRRREGRTRR